MASDFSIISEYMMTPPFIGGGSGNFSEKSFLFATLHAIKLHFYKLLGVSVELSFSDYVKQQWKLNNKVEYPRGYVSLTNFEVIRDRSNNRALRIGGIPSKKPSLNESTGNFIKSAKVFPIKLSFELHYFDSDMNRCIFMIENLAVLSAIGGFSFSVSIQDKFEYQAKVTFDDSISLPILDLSNESDPGSIELTLPFTVETYVGRIDNVANSVVLTDSEDHRTPNISM